MSIFVQICAGFGLMYSSLWTLVLGLFGQKMQLVMGRLMLVWGLLLLGDIFPSLFLFLFIFQWKYKATMLFFLWKILKGLYNFRKMMITCLLSKLAIFWMKYCWLFCCCWTVLAIGLCFACFYLLPAVPFVYFVVCLICCHICWIFWTTLPWQLWQLWLACYIFQHPAFVLFAWVACWTCFYLVLLV